MRLISWIKGKLKQREMRNLEPDKEFEFEEEYYGDINSINGFKIIYSNNYTEDYYKGNERLDLSYISCAISVPAEIKAIKDLAIFTNYIHNNYMANPNYNNMSIILKSNNVYLFLRGNISFYEKICNNIHNNIFTKYIRNNIFVEESPIETPNEFLPTILNSVNNPYKDIDILFIEEEIVCKDFSPVIGLSISEKFEDKIIEYDYKLNNRYIIYLQINKLNDNEIEYLVENVKYGDKLPELLNKYVTNNDYLDIDEVIEE